MGVIENMKDIADLIKKAGDLELYRKISESEGEVIELTRENRRLEEKVGEMQKALALQKQMHFTEPFYYQEGDKTPFCSSCWETKKVPVHVNVIYDDNDETRWDCPSCKYMYLIKKGTRRSVPGHSGPSGPNSWMAS